MAWGSSTKTGEAASHDHRLGVCLTDGAPHGLDPLGRCRVDLVDDDDVGPAQVGLARVVGGLVAGAMRIHHDDLDLGPIERQVVVSPVPDDDVGLLLRLGEDGAVVDAGVDDSPRGDVRLVLLALLDGALLRIEILGPREPLDPLPDEIAVGHRVPDGHDPKATGPQDLADPPCRLALATARANSAHGDDGHTGRDHARVGPDQPEVRPGRQYHRGAVHHGLVRDVAVREDDLVARERADQCPQLRLGVDGDPVRIARAGEGGRIATSVDVRDLRRRERNDGVFGVVTQDGVEVVEVAAGGSHDDDPLAQGSASQVAAPRAHHTVARRPKSTRGTWTENAWRSRRTRRSSH